MVTRNDVGLVLGLAGFLLGAFALFHSYGASGRVDGMRTVLESDGVLLEQLVNDKTQLQSELREANKRLTALRTDLAADRHLMADIEERLDALDRKGRVLDPKLYGKDALEKALLEQRDPAPQVPPAPQETAPPANPGDGR